MQAAAKADRNVIIVGLNFAVAKLFARLGILDKVHETHRVATRYEAVSQAVALIESRHAGAKPG
jgi:hypothetical protein